MISEILLNFSPLMFFGILLLPSLLKVACVPSQVWKLEDTVKTGSSGFACFSESSNVIGFFLLLPGTIVGFVTDIDLVLLK